VNLLLFEASELDSSGRVRLVDRRASHLLQVLRVEPGQRLRAALWRGPLGNAEVEHVQGGEVALKVELEALAPPAPEVDLVLALPRPKVLSRVLETAAAFGVRRIELVNAWRVDKAYFASPRLEMGELIQHARLGCEQGGQPWLPEISVYRFLLPFLEEQLRSRVAAENIRHRWVAHPHATTWLERAPGPSGEGRVVLALGPEGGWVESELASFAELGFVPVKVSRAILRVESALAALLAGLEVVRRMSQGKGAESTPALPVMSGETGEAFRRPGSDPE
jgi:RsmE family RNA methyltransferase